MKRWKKIVLWWARELLFWFVVMLLIVVFSLVGLVNKERDYDAPL